jgi:hypothetical protein
MSAREPRPGDVRVGQQIEARIEQMQDRPVPSRWR